MTRRGVLGTVSIDGQSYACIERTVEEVKPLADQIRTGLSDSDRSDDYETASRFLTWHEGFGLGEIRDASDKGRYHYAQNIDARFRGQLVLGPQLSSCTFATNPESKHTLIEYNGNFYSVGARYVHILDASTKIWSVSKDMGATASAVKGCATVYGDYLVVAAGSAVNYWRLSTAGVWDQPYAANNPSLFGLVGNTLWMVYGSNQLASSVNFTTWTTAVAIGDSRNVATMVTDYNGNPLTGKPEGLFEYDGTKVSNRLPELAFRLDATNCRGGKPSRGKLYLPVGPALWQYTADAVQTEGKPTRSAEYLAPGITRESSSEVRGAIKDLWPDVDFLWAILAAQSGNYYICAYDYNPTAGHGWHQVVKTGTTAVTAIGRFQPSSGNPLMFYSEGTAIKYFLLPANALNPYVDTNYRYALSGDIYFPVEADTFDDVSKSLIAVKIQVDGVDGAGKYVDLSYAVDGGNDTSLGRVTTTGISPVYWPSNVNGRRTSLHVRIVTDNAAVSPRVLPLSRHFQYRFDRKRLWKLKLTLARKALPNTPKQAATQLSDLGSARDSVSAVSFTDLDRQSYTAFVRDLKVNQVIDDGAEQVDIIEVELLQRVSGLGTFRWNSDTVVYDENFVWSNGTDSHRWYWS